jgi:hypothetical protein
LLPLADCAATNGPNAYSITSSASASSFGGISRPRLGSFEVDDQFDFDRLLHRQIGGVFAPEYPAGIDAHQTKSVSDAGSVSGRPLLRIRAVDTSRVVGVPPKVRRVVLAEFDTLLCELASLLDTPPETIRELAANWYVLVFPTGSRQYQYDIERVSLCVTNYWPA